MVKVRLQGTAEEIEQFVAWLESKDGLRMLEVSKPYANRGNSAYVRVYAEMSLDDQAPVAPPATD